VRSRWLLVLLVIALSALSASAQTDRGTITGRVADPSGAVVPNAEVIAMNLDTGAVSRTVSNELGLYTILNLPIGTYRVEFKVEGFKTFTQEPVSISIGQVVRLDANLAVGASTESISVVANASPLETETANLGTNMKGRDLTVLPLSVAGGRDISRFAFATVPTVQGMGSSYDLQASTTIAGSQGVTKAVVVDGTDYNAGIQGVQPPPGMEAVDQFEVQTVVGADAFATGGGAFMYTLKSGTNDFHGSAYGILANEALDANTWDNNFFGYPRARDRYKDWGFSAGGPLYLPKLYNGRNKTFLFGSYEHYNQTDLRFVQNGATVPTNAMLGGDFSALLGSPLCTQADGSITANCGAGAAIPLQDTAGQAVNLRQGMIFDPQTQLPFHGNVVPPDRISAQSQKVIALYKKYYAPMNDGLSNNYPRILSGQPLITMHNLDLKGDQHFGEKNHLSASLNYSRNPATGGDLWSYGSSDPGPLSYSQLQMVTSKGARFIDDHILTPRLFNTFSVAYNNWHKDEVTGSPADNAALGFAVPNGAAKNDFPMMDFGGLRTNGMSLGEQRIGTRYGYSFWYNQWHIRDSVSWLKGRHTLKFGGEFILFRPEDSGGAQNYWYTFSSRTGLPNWLSGSGVADQVGFGFANFVLGDVGSANHGVAFPTAAGRNGLNSFVNDSIKVTSKLTVNAGLRWDFNTRYHEYNGRWTNFNPDGTNPAWAPLKGAYEYASSPSDSWERNQNYRQFAPYVGAAFQVTPKLVARASWGMHYSPLGINQWGALPYNLFGEAHSGYIGASGTVGVAPNAVAFNWDQNVYGGVSLPSSTDPTENRIHPWFVDGGTVSIDPDFLKLGTVQNWNVGVQYELAKDAVLDINYIGNRGRNLHNGGLDPRNYATLDKYLPLLKSGHAGDWIGSEAGAQAAGVPWYPFLLDEVGGWGGYFAFDGIAPFPQLVDNCCNPVQFVGSPLGRSAYQGLVVEFKKRTGNGIAADLNYTFERATGNTDGAAWSEGWVTSSWYEDPYAYAKYANTVTPGIPHHDVKGYLVYELPFGKSKRWLSSSGALNHLVGGWRLGAVVRYRSGMPLQAPRSSNYYPGWSAVYAKQVGSLTNAFRGLDLNNPGDAGSQVFDPNAFQNPEFGSFGNPKIYSYGFTGWSYFNEDFSINKSLAFGKEGRLRASLRAEFFNVLNRHHWSDPVSGSISSPNFGHVTGVYGNRRGQFGARFEW
jgi:hypothetical protein